MIDALYTCYRRAINVAVLRGDTQLLRRARALRQAMNRRILINIRRERGLHG